MVSEMGFVVYLSVFLAGIILGFVYFGGLWWTIEAVSRRNQPAWSLALSFVLRITLLMGGLYSVLLVGVWHLVACLVGLFTARKLLLRYVSRKVAELLEFGRRDNRGDRLPACPGGLGSLPYKRYETRNHELGNRSSDLAMGSLRGGPQFAVYLDGHGAVGGWVVALTRRLVVGSAISIRQCVVEGLVEVMAGQIRDVTQQAPRRYLPFIGSLFLFIAVSNILTLIPGFLAPTSSVITTSALAICVFFAVPIYGIADRGWKGYFSQYLRPTPFMLPFHIMGELSRTLALAVRLFGNMMSGAKIAAILLAIVPFLVPIPLTALSLLTGFIQAYIFAILAMVYIASATQAHESPEIAASERDPQYLPTEAAENSSITDKGDATHG